MMLKHSTIPPQVGLRNLNPKLRTLIDKNFRIATEKAQWNRKGEHPRRALLNNFGAAGSNAALLLEEYPEGQTLMGQERPAYNFILSARTENALKELISLHTDNLRQPDLQVAIQDICYTVSARRRRYTWTTSMVCRSVSHLLEQLQQGPDIHQTVSNASPPIVFVFSGQGSSYAGMGQGLLSSAPLFREKVDECERILARLGYSNILHTRNGQFTPESPSDLVLWPQVACFVLEYALASLWLAWGVQPALVVGHR
jgi:acyl transferase domain-containing protein